MLSLILTIAMVPAAPVVPQTSQIQTCQWPHKCVSAPVAQIQTCVWPHVCVETPAAPAAVAQIQTCQWPHTCAAKS